MLTHLLVALVVTLTGAAAIPYLRGDAGTGRLAPFQSADTTRFQRRLRRVGAVTMLVLALSFFAGFMLLRGEGRAPGPIVLAWLVVALCLIVLTVTVAVDVWLTGRAYRRGKGRQP